MKLEFGEMTEQKSSIFRNIGAVERTFGREGLYTKVRKKPTILKFLLGTQIFTMILITLTFLEYLRKFNLIMNILRHNLSKK